MVTERPDRPAVLGVEADGLPAELRALPRWVVWRHDWNPKTGAWAKVPYRPDGRKASTTDAATWSPFAEALAAYRAGGWDGVGYVFGDDPYCGVDLDDVRDPGTGELLGAARDVLFLLASYAEVSPSGTGVKVVALGRRPGTKSKYDMGGWTAEVYDSARYFALTGRRVPGLPPGPADAQADLDRLFAPPARVPAPPAPPPPPRPAGTGPEDRAAAYLDTIPGGVQGQNGSDPMMWAARVLVWGFCLPAHSAFALLKDRYGPRCDPPWDDDREVWHKVEAAGRPGFARPYGWLLDAPPRHAAPAPSRNGVAPHAPAGTVDAEEGETPAPEFPAPIPASLLRRADPLDTWLWDGYLARDEITLLSALWKAGKTTLLAHLLVALGRGGEFCGRAVRPSRVLYVAEEGEGRWAERRDKLGIADHVEFRVRPFAGRPSAEKWASFLAHVAAWQAERRYDVVIFDTLANLWPVRDENDAAGVQTALMPLHSITPGLALLLAHHNRKSDGVEATAARGSGALSAFVDTIVELRRFNATDRKDTKRVLTGYGRHDETPLELVVDLREGAFRACAGDRHEVASLGLLADLPGVLPEAAPGLTADEVLDGWPSAEKPTRRGVLQALQRGHDEGVVGRDGTGKRGSPYRFWMPPPAPPAPDDDWT